MIVGRVDSLEAAVELGRSDAAKEGGGSQGEAVSQRKAPERRYLGTDRVARLLFLSCGMRLRP